MKKFLLVLAFFTIPTHGMVIFGAVGQAGPAAVGIRYPAQPASAGGALPILVQSSFTNHAFTNVPFLSFNSNTTAGNMILVNATSFDTPGPCLVTSVADTQLNSYAVVKTSGIAGNPNRSQTMYYAANIAGGAATVTITWDAGTCDTNQFWLGEYSGLSTSSPLEYSNSTSITGTAPGSGPLIVTGDSKLIVAALTHDGEANEAIGAGSGYTMIQEFEDGGNGMPYGLQDLGRSGAPSPGVIGSSFTTSNHNANVIGAVFK